MSSVLKKADKLNLSLSLFSELNLLNSYYDFVLLKIEY